MKFFQPTASSLQSKVLSSIAELATISGPIVLVGGTFDGVHRGHQALIKRAQEEAERLGGTVVVMTFDQHPVAFLRPEKAPKLLTTTSQKIELLQKLGVSVFLLLPFNQALASTPAEQFIHDLAAATSLRSICIGEAWSFGQGGQGNLALLKKMGAALGFSAITLDPIQVDDIAVSSTRIRHAIAEAHLQEASACLGRNYFLSGPVVHGAGRGKALGFPTANLSLEGMQLPRDGVYCIRAHVRGDSYCGLANVGRRPTVALQDALRVVEVHLLDFQGDLYGQEMNVELLSFLREEQKFPNVEALKNQIQKDIEQQKLAIKEDKEAQKN